MPDEHGRHSSLGHLTSIRAVVQIDGYGSRGWHTGRERLRRMTIYCSSISRAQQVMDKRKGPGSSRTVYQVPSRGDGRADAAVLPQALTALRQSPALKMVGSYPVCSGRVGVVRSSAPCVDYHAQCCG